ncbi:MAG: hypothetical protein QE570_19600 [Verrucomicrobiota bacterium]|nr:hypothetical protein [Verrucomicrobiota bacterium]
MKCFVFINNIEMLLRFVSAGAFRHLAQIHDFHYVVLRSSDTLNEEHFKQAHPGANVNVHWVPFRKDRFRCWNELFDVSCVKHRLRSASFDTRCEQHERSDPARFERLKHLAAPAEFDLHRQREEKRIGCHPEMLRLVLDERPDFFVLPSALLDYVTDDVLQISHELDIPTLMLVAGWDNLSSKGLLYHKPSMMGVWGEQNKTHGITIQDMPPENVRVVGAPHYEYFRDPPPVKVSESRRALGLPEEGLVVLFAGTMRLFDETDFLKEIDAKIEEGALPPMHLIYRPHPWRGERQDEADFFSHAWKHVTMDPDIAPSYRSTKETGEKRDLYSFIFRLQHLARVYQSVDAVISPMSTVLLESMMFGLPILAMAFGDGKHWWSADKAAKMIHFNEFYDTPGVLTCRDKANFMPALQKLVTFVGDTSLSEKLKASTNFFVEQTPPGYSERAAALAEEMMTRASSRPRYDIPHKQLVAQKPSSFKSLLRKLGI